jgi:hypothetical protein
MALIEWNSVHGRLFLDRLSIFAFLLVLPLLVVVFPHRAAAAPVLNFSIYAPVQHDSPLHIVGLHYDERGVHIDLSNDSDKVIVGAYIVGINVVPLGCAAGPREGYQVTGLAGFDQLRMGAHERAVASREGSVSASQLVSNARHLETAYLQFQVGVVEADFADGTKWRTREYPQTPFDPSLADSDAGKCPDATAAIKALSMTDGVQHPGRFEKPSFEDENGTTDPPRLRFSCSLEGSKAFCSAH